MLPGGDRATGRAVLRAGAHELSFDHTAPCGGVAPQVKGDALGRTSRVHWYRFQDPDNHPRAWRHPTSSPALAPCCSTCTEPSCSVGTTSARTSTTLLRTVPSAT